jgi:hypothetical protein
VPFDPVGCGFVSWVPASRGGRQTGPPVGPDYRVTAVFAESLADAAGPAHADEHFSIWLRFLGEATEAEPTPVEIDFLYREGLPPLAPGVPFMVMEGGRVVAKGVFEQVGSVEHT